MYKSCNRCGKIHDYNYTCYTNRQNKKSTRANKFRKTNAWAKKSLSVRERDKYLCQVCMANIYNTTSIYNYNKLEVHHIESIEERYDLRLKDTNLITLCCYHHKLADKGVIKKEILKILIEPNYDIKKIKNLL